MSRVFIWTVVMPRSPGAISHPAGTGSNESARSTSKAQPPCKFMTMLARLVMVSPRVWLSINGAAWMESKKGMSMPNNCRKNFSEWSMSEVATPMCCMPWMR